MVLLSDRVQLVKCNRLSFGWGSILGGIPKGRPFLCLIYVNDMLLQIQNGSLLQFADDKSFFQVFQLSHLVPPILLEGTPLVNVSKQ